MKFQAQHTQRMQHNICTVTRFYHYYNSELLLLLFIGGPQIMCLSVFVCLRERFVPNLPQYLLFSNMFSPK